MKISVPGQQAGQGNLNIGKPQHESTRLSDIFFCELSNVSSQLDGDSSVSEYFQIQREHLIVQPNDRMNETTVSSHYNSDNLFSNTNSKFTSELSSPDTSKAFDRPATPPSEAVKNAGIGQNIVSNEHGESDTTQNSTFGPVENDTCFADESSASIVKSPIRKKQKQMRNKTGKGKSSRGLKLTVPNNPDRTFQNPTKNTVLGNPSISSITKNQKDGYNLFLVSADSLRKLTIGARGVCKKGYLRWICADRDCRGFVKTQINKSHIEAYKKIQKDGTEKKRFDYRLKSDITLEKKDLDIFDASLHSCIPVDTKLEAKEKICEKAKQLCEEIEPETIRRPTRSEIVSKAVKHVLEEYRKNKIVLDPIALKRTCIPRAISRKLLKVLPLLPEITFDNRSEYVFAPEFDNGNYPLDREYASDTDNKNILFYNLEILSKLSTGQSSVICDSTFPLKRKSIFSQLWIILKTDESSTEIACAVWMSDQKKESYLHILKRLEVLCGKQLWVKSIVTDGEIGQANALYEKIKHSDSLKCAFHGTQTILRCFKANGVGKFLPNKNKKVDGPVATLCTHVWHVCSLLPYFPIDFSLAMIDYLIIHSIKSLNDIDPITEINLETILMKTRKMFQNDHSYSWYSILTRHITPSWSDVTSNKLERLNGQLKVWLNNNSRSRRVTERMRSTQNWLDDYFQSNLVFSNQPCRKPSKKIRERRNDILEILQEIYQSLNQTDLDTLVKIDNMIFDMNCMSNQWEYDSDDETWSGSESESESETELETENDLTCSA